MKNQENIVEGLSEKVQNLDAEVDNRISQFRKDLLELWKEVRCAVALLDDKNTQLDKIERKTDSPTRSCEPEPPAKIAGGEVAKEPHLGEKIVESVGMVLSHLNVKV